MTEKIRATFRHPPDSRLPWTEAVVATAVGKPLTHGVGGPEIGIVVAARLEDGYAVFEAELGSSVAAVDLTTEQVYKFAAVPTPKVASRRYSPHDRDR